MATPKVRSQVNSEEQITIQRLETVAVIRHDPTGEHSMVAEAFLQAGEYLNQRAGRDGEADILQFRYQGWLFRATAEEPPAQAEPMRFTRLEEE